MLPDIEKMEVPAVEKTWTRLLLDVVGRDVALEVEGHAFLGRAYLGVGGKRATRTGGGCGLCGICLRRGRATHDL